MADNTTPASVRRELTQKFEALPIFKRDRATALYHYCVALDMSSNPYIVHPDLWADAGRHAVESSTRGIPAIFRLCPAVPTTLPVQFNAAVFIEAKALDAFAFAYDQIMYCFGLADRGQFDVRYDALGRRTVFSYASSDASAADTLLRTHERDAQIEEATESDKALVIQLAGEAKSELERTILFVDPDAISYPFSSVLLAVARRWADVLAKARRWEFPPDLSIGNVTFGDVRKFWSAVDVIAAIHEMAHMVVAQGEAKNRPKGSMIAVKSREEWSELIREIAGIGAGAALELLWWYTFDLNVSGTSGPIQPFLEMVPGHLCVPAILVTTSNIERNLQKLLNRHPNLRSFYEKVKAAKETIALAHLSAHFPDPAFAVKPTVIIPDVTDADLLVFERATGFVLVIQHKWLIAPETAAESGSNDDSLRVGATQAVEARDAFRGDHAFVRRALGLANDQTISRIEAVVVCRGSEQTGFLGQLAVPLVLERAFEELWEQSSRSLVKLWKSLSSRPDHAQAASRYGDTAGTMMVGGFEFSIPALSLEVQL